MAKSMSARPPQSLSSDCCRDTETTQKIAAARAAPRQLFWNNRGAASSWRRGILDSESAFVRHSIVIMRLRPKLKFQAGCELEASRDEPFALANS